MNNLSNEKISSTVSSGKPSRNGTKADAAKPVKSLKISADSSFSQSNAFSYPAFTRGQVDPRTGSFNYTIPIGRVSGAYRMGPDLELVLRYDHFSGRNEGFGIGWSFGLSRFVENNSKKKLILRDGRVMDLKENGSAYAVENVDIMDFFLKKPDPAVEEYQIAYKDGTTETLTIVASDADGNDFMMLTEVTSENGSKLKLKYIYDPEIASDPYLSDIWGDDNVSLIEYRVNGNTSYSSIIYFTIFPNTDSSAIMYFQIGGTIDSPGKIKKTAPARLPNGAFGAAIFLFTYTTIGAFQLITEVKSNVSSPATETISYDSVLKAPPGAPWDTVPAVSSYVFSLFSIGTLNWSSETHKYSYGSGNGDENNYLGWQGVTTWDDSAIDNLYSCDGYTYSSNETVLIDDEKNHIIIRKYDKFHRMLRENTETGEKDLSIKKTFIYYDMQSDAQYALLPRVYKLPYQSETSYTTSAGTSSRRVAQTYDDFGNLINEKETGGFTTESVYYPATGTPSCPAEKNGFVRYLDYSTRYLQDKYTNSVTRTCIYTAVSNKDDYSYVAVSKDETTKIKDGQTLSDYQTTYYDYYPSDAEQGSNRGRLKATRLSLSDFPAQTEQFDYSLSADKKSITITTTFLGNEGGTVKESDTTNCLTGQTIESIDMLGVVRRLTYDNFGRLASVVRAAGTPYEASTNYMYVYGQHVSDSDVRVYVQQIATPVQTFYHYYDALGNIVRKESGNYLRYAARYSASGLLMEEHHYDYDVPTEDGKTINLDLVDRYEYDLFGNTRKVTRHDGVEILSVFNAGDSSLTESVVEETREYDVVRTEFDYHVLLPLQVRNYASDGKTEEMRTVYTYDEFRNLVQLDKESVPNVSGKIAVEEYGYDFYDRISRITQRDDRGSTTTRQTSFQYWPYDTGSLVTSMAIDGVVVATMSYDDLGRVVEVDRNPGQTVVPPIKYTYASGYGLPTATTTANGITINRTYIPEMGCLPDSVTPVRAQTQGVTKFTYEDKTERLTSESTTYGEVINERKLTYDYSGFARSEEYIENSQSQYTNIFDRSIFGLIASIKRSSTIYANDDAYCFYNTYGQVSRFKDGNFDMQAAYYADTRPRELTYRFTLADGMEQRFLCDMKYDYKGRMVEKSYLDGDGVLLSNNSVQYDEEDRVVKKSFSIKSNNTEKISSISNEFDYLGRLTKSSMDDNSTEFFKSDSGAEISSYAFEYDNFDNMTYCRATERNSGQVNVTEFKYAGKNKFELTSVSCTDATGTRTASLIYDESGNVIKLSEDTRNESYTYDDFNQLIIASLGDTTSTYVGRQPEGELAAENTLANKTQGRISKFAYSEGTVDASMVQEGLSTDKTTVEYMSGPNGIEATCAETTSGTQINSTQSLLLTDIQGSVYGEINPASFRGRIFRCWSIRPTEISSMSRRL